MARCMLTVYKININNSRVLKSAARNVMKASNTREAAIEKNIITETLSQVVAWYENVTGMDEVRLAQNRVLEAESKFIQAQERRREANRKVAAIQNQLKDLYAELDKTTRGEERYLHLITQEHSILKEERQFASEFQQAEREERDYFSSLSSAVKESHEKERAQAERTKYWSIIGSVIGTVIGVVGSTINNNLKMKELKKLISNVAIQNQENNLPNLDQHLESKLNNELLQIITEMKNVSSTQEHVHTRLGELANSLDKKLAAYSPEKTFSGEVASLLKKNQDITEKIFKDLKQTILSLHAGKQFSDEQAFTVPTSSDEWEITQKTKLVFIGTATAVLVPVILWFMGIR
ncbi:uncharacterized protein LOC134527993 [Bacillus rossius redtenbacheri]|uniref:uncharacterized protein LOC134527993 n=1 Tax=Bacillus rossius redtenbacheri TaxID=93214 RepID=UPI002FDD35A4